MPKFLPVFIFSIFLALFCVFAVPGVSEAACADVPLSDNYEVTSDCAFSGDVNGVEQGNLIISGTDCGSPPPGPCTLTINAGQVIVFNPGQRVTVNGRLAIAKDGRLSVSYIWYPDADNDNFPDNFNATSSRESPGSNYWRRSDSHFTTPYSACEVTTVEAMTCGGGRWLNNESCETTTAGYYSPKCDNLQYACAVCKTSSSGAEICSNRAGNTQPTGCTGCYYCNGSGVCVLCRWASRTTGYHYWPSGSTIHCNWDRRNTYGYTTSHSGTTVVCNASWVYNAANTYDYWYGWYYRYTCTCN